jgi:hypothetical protein
MNKKNSQHSVIFNVDILPLILTFFTDDVRNQYEVYNCLFIHSTWTKVSLKTSFLSLKKTNP